MYHAVADTIRARLLLASFPEVDPAKIGVMGISWGGVVTATVMGIDPRFAFAIPTYGCGFLAEAENQYGVALATNAVYRQVWEPGTWLSGALMPALWLTGLHDAHFPLDIQRKSYRAAPARGWSQSCPG